MEDNKSVGSDVAEKIVNEAHQKDMKNILNEFDKFLKEQKKKNICAIMPEMTIAKYCLAVYNNFAKDKAIISFVPKDAKDEWTGKVVAQIRQLTEVEINAEGWDRGTTAIDFTDGTTLYPSQDDEGNGPGTFFGRNKKGETFYVFAK